jgi:hypothetical protein
LTPPHESTSRGRHRPGSGRFSAWLRRLRNTNAPSAPVLLDEDDTWTVDRAARALATACVQAGRTIPAVLAVVVGPDTIRFRLAAPDEQPPAGWTTEHEGRTWQAALPWPQSATVDESAPEPYPQLVSLGATGDGFVLLNLDQAGGVVSLDGDASQAEALAEAWARELTTRPWARGVQVVRVGFQADPAESVEWVEVPNLAEAEPVLSGSGGGVLLLAVPPAGRDSERLRLLAEDHAGRWSVVVVGSVADARLRFTVDPTGLVDPELLDGPAVPPEVPANSGATADPGGQPAVPGRAARPRGRFGALLAAPRAVPVLTILLCLCLLAVAVPIAVPRLMGQSSSGRSSTSHTPSRTPVPTVTSPPPASPSPSITPSPSPSSSPPSSRPPSTPATVAPGGTGTIRNVATGLCVDSDTTPVMALNGTPSGGHAFSSACNAAGTQQWSEGPLLSLDSPRADDMYRLVNRRTGFCLDSNEQGIYTLPCLDPDAYQVWQRVRTGPTTVAYRNQAANRCLSVSKTDSTLRTESCPTGTTWPEAMLFRRLP